MAANYYELWDLEAGNMMGANASEAVALAAVRAGVDEDNVGLWHAVGLRASGDDTDDSRRIAIGDDLSALVRAVATAQETLVSRAMTVNSAGG